MCDRARKTGPLVITRPRFTVVLFGLNLSNCVKIPCQICTWHGSQRRHG